MPPNPVCLSQEETERSELREQTEATLGVKFRDEAGVPVYPDFTSVKGRRSMPLGLQTWGDAWLCGSPQLRFWVMTVKSKFGGAPNPRLWGNESEELLWGRLRTPGVSD